jgi:hypothetical protein
MGIPLIDVLYNLSPDLIGWNQSTAGGPVDEDTMTDLQVFECVLCFLAARVGLPGLVLVTLGIYIAHWQSKRQPMRNVSDAEPTVR